MSMTLVEMRRMHEVDRLRDALKDAADALRSAISVARVYDDDDWAGTFERAEKRARAALEKSTENPSRDRNDG